jgi:hypothetical protein
MSWVGLGLGLCWGLINCKRAVVQEPRAPLGQASTAAAGSSTAAAAQLVCRRRVYLAYSYYLRFLAPPSPPRADSASTNYESN